MTELYPAGVGPSLYQILLSVGTMYVYILYRAQGKQVVVKCTVLSSQIEICRLRDYQIHDA